MDARILDGRLRATAMQLLKLKELEREAKKNTPGNHRRFRPRSYTRPGMFHLELRELLIREASFVLWRKWWPSLPESHLREAISKCSLAVLIYCAHKRLGKDLRMWWTL
jgi:hypothetical protein